MRKIILTLILTLSIFLVKGQVLLNQVDIVSPKTKKLDPIYGIDVSFYQGKIEWSKLDSNIKFVIIKSSEGIRRVDYRFQYNWDNCKITKGIYHFFRPQYSGTQQGKLFLSLTNLDSFNIRPVIDVEFTPYWVAKRNRKIAIKNLNQMVDYIESRTGVNPIIYTSVNFWNKYIKPNFNNSHTLWIADFRNQGPPHLNWSIWQYTCKGRVSGIRQPVDKNITYNIDTLLFK
jgi:lysozyme